MKRILWLALPAVCAFHIGCGPKQSDTSNVAGNTSAASPATATPTGTLQPQIPPGLPTSFNPNPPANPGAGPLAAATPAPAVKPNPQGKPEEVVAAFLDGMRHGNAQLIESLLSTPARKEIADKGLDISPIGSPQAVFEIEKSEAPDPNDPNTVLVTSYWTEPLPATQQPGASPQEANAVRYEVVWELVREPQGWKIYAMAVDTGEVGADIQVVNFEKLDDLAAEAPRTAALPGGNPAQIVPPPNFNPTNNAPNSVGQPLNNSQFQNNGLGLPPQAPQPGSGNQFPPASLPGNGNPGLPPSSGVGQNPGLPPLPTFGPSGPSNGGNLPPLPPNR